MISLRSVCLTPSSGVSGVPVVSESVQARFGFRHDVCKVQCHKTGGLSKTPRYSQVHEELSFVRVSIETNQIDVVKQETPFAVELYAES